MDAEELIKHTSETVRSALEAAQRRADEIVREAEAEAQRIRTTAEAEARERLDQVRQALERLEAGLGVGSAPQGPRAEPKRPAAEQDPEPSESESEARKPGPGPAEPSPGNVSTEALVEQLKAGGQSANAEPEPEVQASNEAPRNDAGAARLVAMKLALDGTSRDEAREQLAAEYHIDDLDSLLDEVYAKAGK